MNILFLWSGPKPSSHTTASCQTTIWELWSVMCFPIYCLPSFCPFCLSCTWQSWGWGCLHTSKAPGGWLLLRQKLRGGGDACMEPTGGEAEPKTGRPQLHSKPGHVVCSNVKHLTWPDQVQNHNQSDMRIGSVSSQIRPQSTEKRRWNNQRLHKCRGAAALLAWPLALLPKTWPTAAHTSPSGTKGTEVGGGDGKEKGSAGRQRVAWRSAAGCQSAHCCRAQKHEHVTHTQAYMNVRLVK